ncbi:MAG: UpxY family transcription antiterminator [Thermodesulfobacteriota bacterium]|nr:UpxY family transcription antiterminator [Thermodesulfobacteriota bacterium]
MTLSVINSSNVAETKKWYAIYTRSRHENKVYTGLKNKNFEVFLPKAEKWSRRKDRRKKIWWPLFPGYIFVQSWLDNYAHHDILKTTGVVKIVGINGQPLPIVDEEIRSLKLLVESGQQILSHDYLKTGDKVIVVEGPMEGVIGTILRPQSKKDKLVISIHLLQRSVAVEMDEWAVKKTT